ncbi:hypothetical protein NLU13_1594 [Sarocladium strictum]|uniref:DUF6590 domain-containing protein n=1 Tax=Sarocladium strictum TaxID=5046 RepID=A0AA39GS36_SARSR|nr:hypothetical protein NLU13_1594 [Sarocladium strictum]
MYRSSKSSKSKSKRWGEYSDWAWEADQKFWYRVRQDADGNLDYDYSYNTSGGQESIPRSGDDVVDELSEDYGNLSLQTDHQDSEYQTAGGQSSSSHGKSRSSKPSKGKERRHERDRYESGADSSRDSRRQPVVDETEDYSYSNATGGGGYATGDTYYQNSYPSDSASSSRQAAYTTADSTYEATDTSYDSLYNQPLGSYAYDQYTTPSGAYAYPAYEQDDGEGRLTPKAGSSSKTSHMAADVSEALDPRYRLERSDRFQPGEIFKAGWAEPKGAANDVLTGLSGKQEIEDTRGVTFVTGFRRFIVIANDQGHSTCVFVIPCPLAPCRLLF